MSLKALFKAQVQEQEVCKEENCLNIEGSQYIIAETFFVFAACDLISRSHQVIVQ